MIRMLAQLSVRRPVTVVMGFIALLVLGVISWERIPLEMMPGRFSLNRMWIWLPYKDTAPRETERLLVRPMEDHLATTPALKTLETRAGSGTARAELEFHRSISMDAAYNAVVDRMERAMSDMPEDLERYWIYRWSPSDSPILWGGIALPDTIKDHHHVATQVVQKRLERVPGVGNVEIWGVYPERVYIDLNLDALMLHGIDAGSVIGALGSDNFQMASGRLVDNGVVRYVRSLARFDDIQTLRDFPIDKGLKLSDIADVQQREEYDPSIVQIEGDAGINFGIYKESSANTVAVSKAVSAAFAELEADARYPGLHFVTFFDQGSVIQESIDNLMNTAMWGGLFAVIVLFAFLRQWRMTLLIAACIPFTLLLTVTVSYFADRSLNLVSLMGLMLAVGMVVDNSIVVVESIYARRLKGDDRKEAAVRGTTEIGLAITLSTLTTMVVFLPIILMTEDADFSFFMSELGMPVIWALGASLVVALIFTPLTTTIIHGMENIGEPPWVSWLTRHYRRFLRWVLTHRTDALMMVITMTWLTMVVPVKAVGCQQDGEGNIGEFRIRYHVSSDATYRERKEMVDTVDEYVRENQDLWLVRTWNSRLRGSSTRGHTTVYLESDRDSDAMSREEVIEDARERLPELPGANMAIGWGGGRGGPPRNQLTLFLHGEDTAALEGLGNEVQRVLKAVPGIIGVLPELEEEGGQEIRLEVDRDATTHHGVTAAQVGRTVGFALRTSSLSQFKDGENEVDILARLRLEDRHDLSRLLDFPFWSPTAMSIVPLRSLTHPSFAQGLGWIHRENRVTSYPITIDLEEGMNKGHAWTNVEGALKNLAFPRGYTWSQDDGWKDEEDNQAQMMALALSITFVFLIMGVLFESFVLPLSIITTVPMAFLGVYWTLYATGTTLDTMGSVGLVILVGVVVNNGIVYIDLVTQLRREGTERVQALIEAGSRRMRPILMTALTTIFGLLPMAMGNSNFIGMPYAPLGRVVAGGLAAGTILTLFLLPFLYTVLDDVGDTARRWFAWLTGRSPTSATESTP